MDIQNVSAATATGHVSSANMPKAYIPKVDFSAPQDTVELSSKKQAKEPASTGKKIGLGVASAFIPGLGQLINGEKSKSLTHFIANLGLKLGTAAFTMICPPLAIACSIGALAANIVSIVDAVKNA